MLKSAKILMWLRFFVCSTFDPQGCGLRKITRSPMVPHHEILGAEHLSLHVYEKSNFFQLPRHPGTSRAQPCDLTDRQTDRQAGRQADRRRQTDNRSPYNKIIMLLHDVSFRCVSFLCRLMAPILLVLRWLVTRCKS